MLKATNFDKRALFLLLPLVAIVIVSGCTIPGTGEGSGTGVVINSFVSDYPTIYSGEEVNLLLKVQNTGDSKATNVEAELTGITPEEWSTFASVETLGDLLAPDREANTPGEIRTIQWSNLVAPYLAKGTEYPYEPMVRVSYDYTTSAQKPITIVDADELRTIIAAGETLPSKSTSYSAGPLNVEISTGNYVKSSGNLGTYDIFPINIHIENTQFSSGSTVVPPIGFQTENYPVQVEINPPAGTNFVYSGFGNNDCSQNVLVDLFRGKEADITCELEVTNPPTIRQEGLITVNLEYRYATDASTTVKVVGTE